MIIARTAITINTPTPTPALKMPSITEQLVTETVNNNKSKNFVI